MEKLKDGMHIEKVFPVFHHGGVGHITTTTIRDGKVVYAMSNSFDGIIYHPDGSLYGRHARRRWESVSHFEDAEGNRYEKERT